MDAEFMGKLGAGLVLGLSSIGVATGMGIAGSAAIGSAKRCFKSNKPVPMLMLALVGFPLTEVIFGFIIMQAILGLPPEMIQANGAKLLGLGIGAGLALAGVGIAEGKAAAAACDSLSDTGKGVALYIGILGIIETVALFVMVFTLMNLR